MKLHLMITGFDTKDCKLVENQKEHQKILKEIQKAKQPPFMPEGLQITKVKKSYSKDDSLSPNSAKFIVMIDEKKKGLLRTSPQNAMTQEVGRSENGCEIRFNPVLGMIPAQDSSNAHYVAFTQCLPKLQPIGTPTPEQPCTIYKIPNAMLRYIQPRRQVPIKKCSTSFSLT